MANTLLLATWIAVTVLEWNNLTLGYVAFLVKFVN